MTNANGGKKGWQDVWVTFLIGVIILAVPLQAVLEAIYWLQYGQWPGWDLQLVLPERILQQIDEIEWVGVRYIFKVAIDIWMSVYVPVLVILGIVIFGR